MKNLRLVALAAVVAITSAVGLPSGAAPGMQPTGLPAVRSGHRPGPDILYRPLAVAPQLHERIHADAAASQHECAVTLIASGKYQQSDAPALVSAAQPAVQFSKLLALNPIWVPAPFFGASIFEHAPPQLS